MSNSTRGQEKKTALYRDLVKVIRNSLSYVEEASIKLLTVMACEPLACELWQAQFNHYKPWILKVIDQTERRVFHGESVVATEKIVSIFEEYSDIIVKGSRDIQYGHKLNLSTGRSGLILDVVIEAGNPADSDRFFPCWNGI